MDARLRVSLPNPDQLQLPIGDAVRSARWSHRETTFALATCRVHGCDEPVVSGWRLCDHHASVLLDELGEAREPYARAA